MAEPYATVGKMVIALGVVLLALGGWLLIVAKYMPSGVPGDVVVRRPGMTVFVPIATMVALSVIATIVVNAVRWWGRVGR